MRAAEEVSDHVCDEVMELNTDVSPAVAEAVSLALIAGAARGLMVIARLQGREGEVRGRIEAAIGRRVDVPLQ